MTFIVLLCYTAAMVYLAGAFVMALYIAHENVRLPAFYDRRSVMSCAAFWPVVLLALVAVIIANALLRRHGRPRRSPFPPGW